MLGCDDAVRSQFFEVLKSGTGSSKAEAEATRLKLSAYSAVGSEAFVRIEVAKSMSEAFQNIKGYLPQYMTVNLLSDSFLKAVEAVVGAKGAEAAANR